MNRRIFLGLTTALALLPLSAFAQDKLPVVASFSILGDMVAQVGGDRVAVTTLVGADGDGHVYQPTPADAQAVGAARLVVVNGLAFEGWFDRLIDAAEYKGVVVIASDGITPRAMATEDGPAEGEAVAEADHDHGDHDHGDFDPHAWQDLGNARIYVANIARGLTEADPDGAETYAANAAAYIAQIETVETEVRAAIAALPADRRTIVTSHDAFGYFVAAYGMNFLAPQGVNTEAEASAADVAALITQIRDQSIGAVFVENISDPRLLEQITAETGAKAGGTLYSDALSAGAPADTYLNMFRHNIATLTAALGS